MVARGLLCSGVHVGREAGLGLANAIFSRLVLMTWVRGADAVQCVGAPAACCGRWRGVVVW